MGLVRDPLHPASGTVSVSTPRGTQTRPAPESAERVVVRRMIRPASKGCQSRACRRDGGPVSVSGRLRGRTHGAAYTGSGPSGRSRRADGRPRTGLDRRPAGLAAVTLVYSQGVLQDRLATARRPVLSSPSPSAPGRLREAREPQSSGTRERVSPGPPTATSRSLACPRPLARTLVNATHPPSPRTTGPIERMDAKQVWRAALGELQVSLSPANYETWLRDTQLVDVEEQPVPDLRPERLREGLARDALPLADQPDAGPDRRLQRPGRVRHRDARRPRQPPGDDPEPLAPGRAGARASRSASSRPGSAARAARPTSTRATRSRTSSSGRPTASPTPPACRSRSAPATPTTRCSCTAAWASARPT